MELWNANSSCGVSITHPSREKDVFTHGEHFLSGEWFAVTVLSFVELSVPIRRGKRGSLVAFSTCC